MSVKQNENNSGAHVDAFDALSDFAGETLTARRAAKYAARQQPTPDKPQVERTFSATPVLRRFEPPEGKKFVKAEFVAAGVGRFTVSLSDEKLYVSNGCVAKTDPDELAEWFSKQVVPGYPDFDGAPLNANPRKYISVSGLSTAQDYEVRWVDSGEFGELVVEEDTEKREDDFLVIATFTLKSVSGKKVFDEFSQLWNSDIAWSESASKSSSSSDSEPSSGSSEPSSGSEPSESQGSGSAPSEGSAGSTASDGSSKDSAVVPHPTKRGLFMKFFTEESTNVPFNYFRRYYITGPVTKCRIDDRYFLACEPDTVRVRCINSPATRSIGGDVQGNEVVLYAGPKKGRPEWADVSFTADRKGFPSRVVEWMEADYVDFAENERRLNPRFVPNPVLLHSALDLRNMASKGKSL